MSNKNLNISLFSILLITIIILISKINIISSSVINFPFIPSKHEEILDKLCKEEHIIFCAMTNSIKYVLSLIKDEYQSFSDICQDNYCFSYKDVYTRNIICENVNGTIERGGEKKLTDTQYIITFSDCNVLVDGTLTLQYDNNVIYNQKFLSEIHFDDIKFYQNKRSTKGEMLMQFDYNDGKIYNYDEDNFVFALTIVDLKSKMNDVLNTIFVNYQSSFDSKIKIDQSILLTQTKYLSETINKFYKGYSLFDVDVDEGKNILTYIAYNDFNYDSFVTVKNKIFIASLIVTFEYALNYNITYNEGNFTISNVCFSRNVEDVDTFGEMINKNADFNFRLREDESKLIWDTINKDFQEKFKKNKGGNK